MAKNNKYGLERLRALKRELQENWLEEKRDKKEQEAYKRLNRKR